MKLLTKALEKQLPLPFSTDGIPLEKKVAVMKFFCPWNRGTWYVLEGRREDEGVLFFTYCRSPLGPDCDELGYVSLSELESVRGPAGLRIERDLYWRPTELGKILSGEVR